MTESSNALDGAIQAFRSSAGIALAFRTEALTALPTLARHLRRFPHEPEAMRLLEQATKLVVAHHAAKTAVLDVLFTQSEADLGHGLEPGSLSKLMYGVVCEQRLGEWFEIAEDWEARSRARAILLAELDEPEARDGGAHG